MNTPLQAPLLLQYALTLENLENTFYSEALKKFDAEAFTKAGLPAFARGRFEQIAAHEKQHVALLSSAISATGGAPVKPCNYSCVVHSYCYSRSPH